MNQCIFSSLSCFIACMQGCHSIHQMANLTNVAKMEFDPTPTYRPITARYLIRFSSFKIWWHDNMLPYAHTKYWIHPITSYTRTSLAGFTTCMSIVAGMKSLEHSRTIATHSIIINVICYSSNTQFRK